MSKNTHKNLGFSLLELVLAIAIFSLGSIAMATLIIDSNLSTKTAIERTEALFYAKEGLEATRSIRDNDWADLETGNKGLNFEAEGSWRFNGAAYDLISDDKYTRVIAISDLSADTKQIISTITWDVTPSREASVSLTTILGNWR
ncbi:MAG: type II secretion system protein [Candidatus Paceibacterota bacterium]